jgi:orotidine-5'-phosphate decarboxylase
MKPQRKAEELIKSFENLVQFDKIYEEPIFSKQQQCALKVVDEIIKLYTDEDVVLDWKYWQDVKQEIEIL